MVLLGQALLTGLLVCLPMFVKAIGVQPHNTNGRYTVEVRGSCQGVGEAVVAGGRIQIQVNVRDKTGTQGSLVVAAMELSGPNFRGDGMVMGRKAAFIGRLDGYGGDKHFKGARLLCSFTDEAGRSGRIAGVID